MSAIPIWQRLLQAGLFTLLLTASAAAQMPPINLIPETQSKTPEEREREEARDKAYRESLKKIPNATASDPWGSVRGNDAAAKAPAKPKPAAPKRAKADTPAN